MNTLVLITGSQLLKHIHISQLQVIGFIGVIGEAYKKTVLIKIIVDDLFTKIYMHLLIYHER
ncbi:MAG: hypothetical protein JWM28_2365 [Chitinophagaceae bacterium]|nr:hypothetical protein [Chitinophagaceae bacterium]